MTLSYEDTRFVAVCGVNAARRQAAKARVDRTNGDHGCAAYRDLHELLAAGDAGAVADVGEGPPSPPPNCNPHL